MVIPYGASKGKLRSIVRRYILKHGKKRGWDYLLNTNTAEKDEKLNKVSTHMADTFWNVVRNKLPGATALKEELQSYCKVVIAARGLPMIWISPIGLPVMQPYFKIKSDEIQSCYYGKQRIKCHLRETTDEIRTSKQVRASSPNFIHALDASHMFMTAAAAQKAKLLPSGWCMIVMALMRPMPRNLPKS